YFAGPSPLAGQSGTAGDGRSASGGLAGQSGTGDPVTPDWFAASAGQPVLLLVPGTFSVGHGTFAGLGADADLLARWWSAYDGRVLAFDHPSVHVDPRDNARWLLSQLPDDRRVVLDVIAHSRGGLVARQLSAKDLADEAGRPAPVVRRLVHVATPN